MSRNQNTGGMTALLRSIAAAFSTYSIFPTFGYQFQSSDLSRMLFFYPLVGVAVGLCLILILGLANWLGFSALLFGVLAFTCNVILTGGIHIDGFADTADAVLSHRDREQMLDIMHDPQIGAMGVIAIVLHSAWQIACFSQLYTLTTQGLRGWQLALVLPVFLAFIRCLAACQILTLPAARQEGMIYEVQSQTVGKSLEAQGILAGVTGLLLLAILWGTGILVVLGLVLWTLLSSRYFMRTFAGISGDLAGCSLLMMENLGLMLMVIGCSTAA